MNNKSIEQWAEESVNRNMLELHEADGRVRHFIAGAAKQKEILSQELEDLRLDFKRVDNLCSNMNEREKLLMSVIDDIKSALTRINYNNYRGIDQSTELKKIAGETLASIEETLKQIKEG